MEVQPNRWRWGLFAKEVSVTALSVRPRSFPQINMVSQTKRMMVLVSKTSERNCLVSSILTLTANKYKVYGLMERSKKLWQTIGRNDITKRIFRRRKAAMGFRWFGISGSCRLSRTAIKVRGMIEISDKYGFEDRIFLAEKDPKPIKFV